MEFPEKDEMRLKWCCIHWLVSHPAPKSDVEPSGALGIPSTKYFGTSSATDPGHQIGNRLLFHSGVESGTKRRRYRETMGEEGGRPK